MGSSGPLHSQGRTQILAGVPRKGSHDRGGLGEGGARLQTHTLPGHEDTHGNPRYRPADITTPPGPPLPLPSLALSQPHVAGSRGWGAGPAVSARVRLGSSCCFFFC